MVKTAYRIVPGKRRGTATRCALLAVSCVTALLVASPSASAEAKARTLYEWSAIGDELVVVEVVGEEGKRVRAAVQRGIRGDLGEGDRGPGGEVARHVPPHDALVERDAGLDVDREARR